MFSEMFSQKTNGYPPKKSHDQASGLGELVPPVPRRDQGCAQ
jgi:hypothetical protein